MWVQLCMDIGTAAGSYGRVNENDKLLAVSVVAGILAANRTNVPRWEQTAAKQALGLVNEVARLLASEGRPAEPSENLTETSVELLKALGQIPAGHDADEPGDREEASISFVDLTQRLDPANWNKRARREESFRDYVRYSMAKTSEARRLLGEEDLPVAGSTEPTSTEIDERMVQLKASRFEASQVKDIEADFMRFLQASDVPHYKRLFARLLESRKICLEGSKSEIAKTSAPKSANRQILKEKRTGSSKPSRKKGG